jgi:hypothetical protein
VDILEIAKRCSAGQAQPGDVELLADYIIYVDTQHKTDLLNKLDKASSFLDSAAKSAIPEKEALEKLIDDMSIILDRSARR